ncbi:MAG: GntR family transcriptional regulator [Clostridia bacterium]|nr:GntR family transcriptional regulator [Clostridia bacterium]
MSYKEIADRLGPRTGATQDWVYQVLKEGIVSGELKGGTQLKQDEISSMLSVSPIPVREALRKLEARGLVHIETNRGATVQILQRSHVMDMMEIRAMLSAMKLKNSAPFLTEEDYRQIAEVIEAQRNATDLMKCEQLNYRFHKLITSHDDNVVADMFMEIIQSSIDRYIRHSLYDDDGRRLASADEHEAIMNACRSGDYEKACELLRDHILNAKDFVPDPLE